MRLGLVGFPQSGRTTLFRALTGSAAADHDPHRAHAAVVAVPDPRLERVRAIYGSARAVPATVEVEDLPAVPAPGSAHLGEGAQAVALMRQCDALVFVVRAFPDDRVPYHRTRPDPARDLADLETELLLSDLEVAQRRAERITKSLNKPVPNKADLEAERALLQRLVAVLEKGLPVDAADLKTAERKLLASFQFLSLKPRLAAVNVGEEEAAEVPDTPPTKSGGGPPNGPLRSIRICAALERDLAALKDPAERADFLKEYHLPELAGPRLVRLAYEVLGAVTFFTAAENEAHAWTVLKGATAVEAAGKVHTDLAKGFIRAEVVTFAHLDQAGSYKEAKARGHVRLEGKEYLVRDGDVMFIRFAV